MSKRMSIALERLQKLEPLSNLSIERLEELISLSYIEKLPVGVNLFHEGDIDNQTIYLLDGDVQISTADSKTDKVITSRQVDAKYPLDDSQPRQVSCTALSRVELVRIDNSVLDYMMMWDQLAVSEESSARIEATQAAEAAAITDSALKRLDEKKSDKSLTPVEAKVTESKAVNSTLAQATESKAVNSTLVQAKTTELKAADSTPAQVKALESKATNSTQVQAKAPESKAANSTQVQAKAPESKAINSTLVQAKTTEPKAVNSTLVQAKTTEPKAADSTPAQVKAPESKAVDSTPAQAKASESKAADSTPAQVKAPESKAADSTPAEPKATESKPVELNDYESSPDRAKQDDSLVDEDKSSSKASGNVSDPSEPQIPAFVGDEDKSWIRKMRHIMAFKNMPPANIKALLENMETIIVEKDEVVVNQGDEGDYYYVLTEGEAQVTRTVDLASLSPGASFGEEALLSEGQRNATVTMKSNGMLMRLSKQKFNALLKEPMLARVSPDDARVDVNKGAIWLDVRHAKEFAFSHLPKAINIPLHEMRIRIGELDKHKHYICYCGTGRRSSAAAFLLVQRGYNTCVLNGGIKVMAQDLVS